MLDLCSSSSGTETPGSNDCMFSSTSSHLVLLNLLITLSLKLGVWQQARSHISHEGEEKLEEQGWEQMGEKTTGSSPASA